MTQTLTLGFSTCPNDTFMFGAIVLGHVDSGDLRFDIRLADVEELNLLALQESLDITKLSYYAYARCRPSYTLLRAGGALGRGCGPLLISRTELSLEELRSARIAIPGEHTTAHFLLRFYLGGGFTKRPFLFSSIEDAILDGQVDAGVIIHENRFTYERKGLIKLKDLGEYWERQTTLPIPLGAIAVRSALGDSVAKQMDAAIRRSIEFAMAHPHSILPYVQQHAQTMDPSVVKSHIELYVNSYSIDPGRDGDMAIQRFLREVESAHGPSVIQSA